MRSPAADTPPALLVYDASLELVSARGMRRVPYDAFHPGYKKMDLQPGEIIARIHMPPRPVVRQKLDAVSWRDYYRKVGTRRAQAISKVCFAGIDPDRCRRREGRAHRARQRRPDRDPRPPRRGCAARQASRCERRSTRPAVRCCRRSPRSTTSAPPRGTARASPSTYCASSCSNQDGEPRIPRDVRATDNTENTDQRRIRLLPSLLPLAFPRPTA